MQYIYVRERERENYTKNTTKSKKNPLKVQENVLKIQQRSKNEQIQASLNLLSEQIGISITISNKMLTAQDLVWHNIATMKKMETNLSK